MIGLLLVICASVLYVVNNETTDYSGSNAIKIDTTNMEGDSIDTSNILDYAIEEYSEGYVNDNDLKTKNKYIFAMPSSAKVLFQQTGNYKIVEIDDGTITANVMLNTTVEELFKNKIDDYDKTQYEKVRTFKSNTNINYDDFEISYSKISALDSYETEDGLTSQEYYEEFNIYLIEKDNKIIMISYRIVDKKFTDELLSELVNKIKLEKGKANYLYSHIEGNNIVGTLNSIDPDEYKQYKLSYSIPKDKYYEKEDANNTESSTNFSSLNEDTIINIKLVNGDLYRYFDSYVESVKMGYDYDNSITRVDSFLTDSTTYNEKEYRRILIEYTDVANNTKHYVVSLIYKIEEHMYYVVTIDSNKNALEEYIDDFLNFSL